MNLYLKLSCLKVRTGTFCKYVLYLFGLLGMLEMLFKILKKYEKKTKTTYKEAKCNFDAYTMLICWPTKTRSHSGYLDSRSLEIFKQTVLLQWQSGLLVVCGRISDRYEWRQVR